MGSSAIQSEIVSHQLLSITEEMATALIRSAFSPNIKERWDCSAAILSVDGEVVAETAHAPVHLGGMRGAGAALLQAFPDMQPGDVFTTNDPYLGSAIHLNDVTVAAPVFDEKGVVALVACVAHHGELGGRVPGGEACDSDSIFLEGLRLPAVRLLQAGELDPAVLDIIAANSRSPIETRGDFRAQIAAVRLGARRLGEVVAASQHDLRRSMDDLLAFNEERFRKVLADLPDGTYHATDWADDDWVTGERLPVAVSITIAGSEVVVDLTDNVDQLASSRNVAPGMLLSTVLFGLKAALDPRLPANSGYGRAIQIETRPGSIFEPRPPAAIALGTRTSQVLLGTMFTALAPIVPERICAGSNTQAGIQLYGYQPDSGRPFLNYERLGGGIGARQTMDGLDGIQFGITNTSNLPIESTEAEYPLRVERYQLVQDTGGPGKLRGGLAARRDIRVLVDGAVLTAQGERLVVAPSGLFGGAPGALAVQRLNPDTPGEKSLPPAFSNLRLAKNDVISMQTAGGGGFGDVTQRDPALVARDLETERISPAAAETVYGYASK